MDYRSAAQIARHVARPLQTQPAYVRPRSLRPTGSRHSRAGIVGLQLRAAAKPPAKQTIRLKTGRLAGRSCSILHRMRSIVLARTHSWLESGASYFQKLDISVR